MHAADWLAVLAWFAVTTLLGAGTLRIVGRPLGGLMRDWSTAYLAGQLVLLVLTLATGVFDVRHRHLLPVVLAFASATAIAQVFRHRKAAWSQSGRLLGFLLLTIALFPNLLMAVHRSGVIETDARGIWMFHGHALFVADGIDRAFFTDPLIWWSSPDYPKLLPAQAAWSSAFVGRWSELACRACLWFHFAAWFRLAYLALSARCSTPWLAFLGATVAMFQGHYTFTPGYSFVSGQADFHCSWPLVLGLLALLPKGRLSTGDGAPDRPTAFVMLMLGYAANTKSEGVFYAMIFAALWTLHAVLRHRRELLTAAASGLPRALCVAAIGLVPWVLWAVLKADYGLSSNLRVLERLTTPGLVQQLLAERLPTILEILGQEPQLRCTATLAYWLAAALVASLIVRVTTHRPIGLRRGEVVLAGAWALTTSLILLIYVITPHDFVFHLKTSVTRLLLLPHLLVFFLVVLRVEALWEALFPYSAPAVALQT